MKRIYKSINQYFFLTDQITSIKFVAELKSKLLLNKVEKIAIKQFEDNSKFIYIFASEFDFINDSQNYIILDCYFDNGYYSIFDISSKVLKALDLTVTQK